MKYSVTFNAFDADCLKNCNFCIVLHHDGHDIHEEHSSMNTLDECCGHHDFKRIFSFDMHILSLSRREVSLHEFFFFMNTTTDIHFKIPSNFGAARAWSTLQQQWQTSDKNKLWIVSKWFVSHVIDAWWKWWWCGHGWQCHEQESETKAWKR